MSRLLSWVVALSIVAALVYGWRAFRSPWGVAASAGATAPAWPSRPSAGSALYIPSCSDKGDCK